MNKLKKSVAVLLILLLAGCSQNTNPGNETGEQQISQEENNLITLAQVRSEIDETMEKAKSGGYSNLKFADFNPIVTEEDVVCDVKELTTQTGMEEKTIEECLEEQYQWLCKLKGYEVEKSEIMDKKSELMLDEVEKSLKKGTYPDEKNSEIGLIMPELLYMEEIKGNLDGAIGINNGKCYKYARFGMVAYSEDLKLIKEYQTNVNDKSLDDSYELEDGPCTIKQAVQWVEDYENGENPYKPGKDIKITSPVVRVYKRKNGTYAYNVGIRRCYKGVTFHSVYQGSSVDVRKYDFDMGEVLMVNRKCPDMMIGLGANEIFTPEGTEYKKIISLDRAFTIINNQVGKNTDCKVLSAEISYCKYPDDEYISKKYGRCWTSIDKVVWKIEVENKRDDRNSIFYIDVTDYDGKNVERVGIR